MSVLSTDFQFPASSALLTQWQGGDDVAYKELRALFDAVIDGQYDAIFQEPVPADTVCVTTSLHMTTLTLLNQFYGLTSADFYKGDPQRYVRTTLMTQRLLGIRKLSLHWPVYAFGAECLGQVTIYPEKHAPSTDAGKLLIDKTNWRDLGTPDLENDVFRVMEDMLACFSDLTNLDPIAHLPAPYSLAAEIFGQEAIMFASLEEPDFINNLLVHLTEEVFVPWCEHLSRRFPNIWLELSDASGSPTFIGPRLFQSIAAPPVRRLIEDFPWGNRVFVANYRGDKPLKTSSLAEIIDFKLSLCPEFIIKLDADKAPLSSYVEQAILREKPLTLGIGAARIDKNSIADHGLAKQELESIATEYTQAIKTVSKSLALNGHSRSAPLCPSDIYIEDINAESDFDLVKTIVERVAIHG